MVSASGLRARITIYRRKETENELEEKTFTYQPVRISACPVIERGMYFTFRRQRYDVLYGYPIYNRRGWLELYCRLVVEDSVPGI